MEFGNRLYELRKQKGLSQEELANLLDVTRQTVSKWELGDSTPDMDKLVALGSCLKSLWMSWYWEKCLSQQNWMNGGQRL